jgi:hypothetical protein
MTTTKKALALLVALFLTVALHAQEATVGLSSPTTSPRFTLMQTLFTTRRWP